MEDTFVLNASSWTFERVRDAEKCGAGLWVVVVFFVVVVVFFVVVVVLIVVVVVFFAVVVVGLSVVVVICLMVVVVSPNSLSILHFDMGVYMVRGLSKVNMAHLSGHLSLSIVYRSTKRKILSFIWILFTV